MNLSQHLHDDVADVHADPTTLARTARAGGARMTRRRYAVRAGGGLAVAAVVAAIVVAPNLRGDGSPAPSSLPVASASDTPPSAPPSSVPPSSPVVAPAPVPVDGRSAVAALMDAADDLDGPLDLAFGVENASIHGSGDDGYAGQEAYGAFDLTTDGQDRVQLEVNVQTWSALGLPDGAGCPASYLDCQSHTLANGDVVRSYRLDDGKDVAQRFAELISPSRDLRIIIGASVPLGAPEPLSAAQLRGIASWPTWSLQLPGEYAAKGQALPHFESI